jgi:hypothetical protein
MDTKEYTKTISFFRDVKLKSVLKADYSVLQYRIHLSCTQPPFSHSLILLFMQPIQLCSLSIMLPVPLISIHHVI